MIKYILKRIFYMAISLVIITTITFFLMKLMPGSPFNDAKLSPDQKYILNEKYGLNDPIPIQYLNYMKNVFTGDFGYSFQYHNQPVWDIIKPRLIPSLEMGITAMIIGMLIGLILGVASAAKQNTWIDYLATIISVLAVSVPSFVLAVILQFVFAVILQFVFAVKLRWFPVAGWEGISTIILPSFALSAIVIATVTRYIRAELLEVLKSDYILLARAKGVSSKKILYTHALRNALIPLVTVLVPMMASILTGTLTIENIFGVPGLGDQFVRSIATNDFPVIMATTILFSSFFIVSIFLVDMLYIIIDPRIRIQGGRN
ncbi:TPA: ABC transporter permease [Staphylococcus aureus]|nr:ABC transporter permease [Staphylococcus aureus]HDC3971433.1 ABC transporter permease [Staphylococcus aureus]